MLKKIVFYSFIFAIAFFAGIADSNSAEITTTLSEVKGHVAVTKAGTEKEVIAEDNMKLGAGDVVKTEKDGSAILVLPSGNIVQIFYNTTFRIEKQQLDDANSSINAKLNLLSGTLKAILDKMPPNSNFEIQTPTVVAAARGTTYYVSTSGQVYVQEGSVTVINLLTGATVTVNAGEMLFLDEAGNVTSGPREPTEDELNTFLQQCLTPVAEPYELPGTPVLIVPNAADPFQETISPH